MLCAIASERDTTKKPTLRGVGFFVLKREGLVLGRIRGDVRRIVSSDVCC